MEDEIKLVAAFMGIPIRSYYGGVFYISDEDGNVDFDNNPEVYRPSKNWNQLIPVVEKIKSKGFYVQITFHERNSCSIGIAGSGTFSLSKSGENCTYSAVVDFIKWYRSQPEGNTVNMK